ncbi:MAG: phenylalanine--tRNA ligase subunit beta [Planctomycetes bacterium]|nr:phenylalanine--tRNA ligase subunit beta [Planctomycetota bacterium]
MKLSLRWLSRHVDLRDLEPKQILADLTMSTAEIEGLERFGEGLECLVIGHVRKRDKHPDADKLSVCTVDLGSAGGVVQIVCGAPNVAAGQRVVVIRPGDTLPDKGGKGALKIKASKIRGVESHGMICSESELGLSSEADGILVLPDDTPIGARFVDVCEVLDWVFEIDNKSINHRPDLWGHYGFARELAAIYGRELRPAAVPIELPASGTSIPIEIDAAAGSACPRYCGLVIDGVVAGPSPNELRWQLAAVGQRAINLPVDLTNYVMLDLGQPMHAFDRRHVGDGPVRVRFARDGEKITTLDGQARTLTPTDLLICAGDRPEALGGVMGGEGTMVESETTSLFLESANFHAATVRRTSMRLGLRTDASARFEKAQDPANAELAIHAFLGLLQRHCPTAVPAGPLVDPAGFAFEPPAIELRRARLHQKLGIELPDDQVHAILESLGFEVGLTVGLEAGAGVFMVRVPSFRATKDIASEDDLIEEVGRMFRYDNIPERPLTGRIEPPPRHDELALARRLVESACFDLGCSEVYNYTFVADAVVNACAAAEHAYVRVQNPVAPDLARIRRHVVPSLLASVPQNLRRHAEVRLVEHGKGYHAEMRSDGLPHEIREIAMVLARREGGDPALPHPYVELRQAVELLLLRSGYPAVMERVWHGRDQPWVHPSRAVAIDRDGSPVGYVAHLHPRVARALDLPATTAIACLDVRALLVAGRKIASYTPVPTYPPLPVDVALLVDEGVQVAAVTEFLTRVGKKLVRAVELFEVYRGERLPAGKKSLNFTVTLGADDRTLDDKDESKYLGKVREQAASIGAELRG